MNLRDEIIEHDKINTVRIKSCGAIFRNLNQDTRLSIPQNITDNMWDGKGDLRKVTGEIVHIFKNPNIQKKDINVFVVKIITGTHYGKYIFIGRTGIKKLGNVTIERKDEWIRESIN